MYTADIEPSGGFDEETATGIVSGGTTVSLISDATRSVDQEMVTQDKTTSKEENMSDATIANTRHFPDFTATETTLINDVTEDDNVTENPLHKSSTKNMSYTPSASTEVWNMTEWTDFTKAPDFSSSPTLSTQTTTDGGMCTFLNLFFLFMIMKSIV